MLESRRLLVRVPNASRRREVFDADGDPSTPVGVAEDVTGPVGRLLRRTRIEVRELPDESLVFTLRRTVLRSRAEVHDAQGGLVGVIETWGAGAFRASAADGRPFAPAGVELGRVTRRADGVGFLADLAEELDGQPLAKMLVFAAALAPDMIFQGASRTGRA